MNTTKTRIGALLLAAALLIPAGVWAAEAEDVTDAGFLAAYYTDADTISLWAAPYVKTVTELELMIGDNGRFKPADSMTRAEFATLLARMLPQEGSDTGSASDIPLGAWYEGAVLAVLGAGLMDAANDCFRPDDAVTREEVSVGIARLLGLDMETSIAALEAQGVVIADWDLATAACRPALAATYLEGIMVGSAGKLNPHHPIQRQEMAKVIGILYQ